MQETGNNSSETNNVMSIQLVLSGHNFLMAVDALNALPKGQACKITISVDSFKTVLVPDELFDDTCAEGYLAAANRASDDNERAVVIHSDGITAVCAVSAVVADLIASNPQWNVCYTTPLLDGIIPYSKTVRISLTPQNCYFVVCNNSLRYAEVFAESDIDNIVFIASHLCHTMKLCGYDVKVRGTEVESVVERLKPLFHKIGVIK